MFDEIVKEPDLHLKFGEKIIAKGHGFMVVDVTACAWLNPPKELMVLEMESVTCEHCIDRGTYKNGWKKR